MADQEKIVEEELNKIKATHKEIVSQVWVIRKKVVGGRKSKVLTTAITNPATNKLVANRKEIKEVTLKYCIDALTNNTPDPVYVEETNQKKMH